MANSSPILNGVGKALFQSDDVQNWSPAKTQDSVLGTTANDYLLSGGGITKLVGGAGDDSYVPTSSSVQIIEQVGGGVDTVSSWLPSFRLPANVENLYVGIKDGWGVGNSLDNILTAGEGTQYLSGGPGNDVLYGGAGSDVFVVRKGEGSDLILDFKPGLGGDQLRLDNYGFADFAAFKASLRQVGADTIATLGSGETLTLAGVSSTLLTASNFIAPASTSGLKLTFSDDFNTFNVYNPHTGSGLWRTQYGYAGFDDLNSRNLASNGEKQVYTDEFFADAAGKNRGLNPFVDKDGILEIHADKVSSAVSDSLWGYKYTSGLITTKDAFAQQYGFFEIRAQAPSGQGLWPCIWLLPSNGGWPPEIDILESIGDASVAHQTSHTNETSFNATNSTESLVFPTDDGYHTYSLSWTKEQLIWFIDGAEVKRLATPSDMHQPMYLLINLVVGGNWSGDPDPATDLHAQLNVDYVHVYSYDNAGSANSPAVVPVTTSASTLAPASQTAASVTASVDAVAATPTSHAAPPTDFSVAPVASATTGGHASGGDLDGDGRADAVWWDSAGQVSAWMSARGQGQAGNAQLGMAGHDWKVIGQAKIDGDSKADLIFWNNNGQVAAWESSRGEGAAGSVDLGVIGHDWSPLALGDFNADGRTDIAWWNENGQVAVWQTSKTTTTPDTVWLGAIGHDWSALGASDFTGDGKTDIAWRNNTTGQVALWSSTATGKMDTVMLGSAGQDWSLLSAADFNGDGRTDLAWWNQNGQVVIWQTTQGGKSIVSTAPGAIGHDWTLLSAADFNGDGTTDLAWRNANGQVAVWQTSKTVQTPQTLWLGSVAADAVFSGVGDYNGDGKADLSWMDASGQLTAWQIQGDHKEVIAVGVQPAGASFVPG